jgi:uncharacterized repeat protein (TIGR03806 family)
VEAVRARRAALGAAVLAAAAALAGAKPDAYEPPRRLSEWGLFEGGKPAPGVHAFDVSVPLFSDYADKSRFLRLPAGQSAVYREEGPLELPVGSVLAKSFGYGGRLLETRLLVRRPSGWVGLPYVWDAAQTDAVLKPAGAAIDGVAAAHGGRAETLRYLVPNMNQCKACHEAGGRGALAPLGVTAANLGAARLRRWKEAGILREARRPRVEYPALADAAAPLERRARAYLDVNCAHCHNPRGPASTAGLDLRFSQKDPVKLGIGKPPVAAGRGTGGRRLGVVPGRPDESILLHRMESIEPGVMMPELGRRLADDEGVELVRRWIAALPLDAGGRR